MATYGFITARVGTQKYHSQLYGILAFAANQNMGDLRIITESSDHFGTRPALVNLIKNSSREDTLIVTDFTQLGSLTTEVLNLLSALGARGVKLYVVNGSFHLDTNLHGQVVSMACSLVDEIANAFAAQPEASSPVQEPSACPSPIHSPTRTRKSRLDGKEEMIRSMVRDGVSFADIARAVETSRQTAADFIHSRNLLPQQPSPKTN